MPPRRCRATRPATAPTAQWSSRTAQTQVVAFTNNFAPPIRLIITKTVVGTGTGPFRFRLACSATGAPGAALLVLPPEDADFSLNHGESKSIKSVPVGAAVRRDRDRPRGAARTFQEASGNANDGVVLIPTTGAITVGVTNRFPIPIVDPPVVAGVNPPPPVVPIQVQPRTVG